MKILLFNASNSGQSIHRQLLDATRAHLGSHTLTYSSTDAFDLPFYSIDSESRDGYPEEVRAFYELLAGHDAVILACPEHNGSVPAAFKNLFDWTSRYAKSVGKAMLAEKKVLLLSASPGPNGGATNLAHLESLLPWQGATVVGRYSIGSFDEHFSDGKADSQTEDTLREAVAKLDI